MPAPKGTRPPAAGIGRKKGVPNKLTAAAKETFELAFQNIGGVEALTEWARNHRTLFYQLWARLIPVDVRAQVETRIVDESRIREIRDSLREASQESTIQ